MKTKILKRTLLLVAMLLACTVQSLAEDFDYNGLTYTILTDNTCETKQGYYSNGYYAGNSVSGGLVIPGTVYYNGKAYSVTKIGSYAFSGCLRLMSVSIPNSVTSIGDSAFENSGLKSLTIPNSVTEISNLAFGNCTGLTEVTIPNSVTSIGDYAFEICTSLTEVTIPNSVTEIGSRAFYYCTGLTELTIPNSVTSIGRGAFRDCSGLTEVTIPNSVTSIDYQVFYGCSGLKSVTIPNSVTSIGECAFENCSGLTEVTIPNSVTSIGEYAFWGCTGLTEVTIPNSVTSIGRGAFSGCSGLTEVTIPNSVTEISSYTFYGCTSLTSLTIPNSVTSIGNRAFEGCTGLTELTIPNSVTKIGEDAFENCSGLKSVTIGNSVISIGDSAFCNCSGLTEVTIPNSVTSIGRLAFLSCYGLKSVTIGNSVTKIGDSAFERCAGLTEVTIPNSVTDIGECAFNWCTGLKSVTIGNSVTSIGSWAFCDCTGLTELTIPNSVTSIGEYAFYGCAGLKSVTIGNSVTSIGEYAFNACPGLEWIESKAVTPPTIYSSTFSDYSVPLLAASDAYRTASYWNEFTNISAPYTPTGTTFEVDGLKYEIISVNDLTCRLYAIDETVTGENVVIPEAVVYKNRTFTPIEIKGVLVDGETSVKSLSISNNSSTGIPAGIIRNASLEKLTINAPITTDYIYFSNIDELVIPSTVTEVSANLSTNNIGKITIEDSETALTTTQFKCDTKEVYLGRNVSESTFMDMTSLEKVTISDKVTSISYCAFYGCTGLTEVTIPNSVTEIGSGAFYKCSGLTEVTIGNSVTLIDYCAFWGCTGLTELTIPNSVTSIGEYAFYDCTGLTSLTIPNSVTLIDYCAFYGCTGLTEVTIPNSVTEIGSGAFRGCSGLTEVTIGNSVTIIQGGAFWGCTGLTELTIPNSVTSIVDSAFYNCSGITSLNFEDGEGNLTIGKNVFTDVAPTEIYFGRQIDFSVVSHTALETVEFGENVTSIASGAFKDGTAIRTVVSRNVTPPTTDDIFCNDTYLYGVLYVPEASIEAYQAAAGWKNFWDIYEISSNVTAIEIDKTSASLHETETVTITANVTPSFASNQSVIWSVSNESVAKISVDETTHICTVTAIAPGTCDIVAKSAENAEITASCTITVLEATYPESIELSEETVTLQEGNSHAISAIISPSDVDVKTVSWSSSDEQVATVSDAGIITGVTEGTCDITATTANGLEAVCHVIVIENNDPVFYEGLVYVLNKTDQTATVTYTESEPKYSGDVNIPPCIVRDGVEYTVTEIGEEAFSDKYGNNKVTQIVVPYTVTTIAKHGFLHCESLTNGLVLGRNVSSIGEGATGYTTSNHIISLNPTPPSMGKDCDSNFNVSGSIYVPKGSKLDYQGANIWSDKKSQIVELDFVSSVSFNSTAKKAPSLDGSALTMAVGDKYTPKVNVEPEDAYTGVFYWKSSDESVAYVSERGKITAIGAGECTIEATEVLTGASATINVKVTDSSSVVDLTYDSADFSIKNGVIKVTGNAPVHIYTVSGLTVYSGRGDARVNVAPGVYVVIVGNTAHKVAVR